MCGRYSITLLAEEISDTFGVSFPENFEPNYNAAPSQNLPIITNVNPDKVELYKWGLIPHWAKDAAIGNKMINARSETILEKPSFKNAFKKQRCLVLADSYYEWKKEGTKKKPYRIILKDKKVFAFAGIWESWKSPDNTIIKSFSIITTQANSYLADLHERMPVFLSDENTKKWIDNKLSIEEAQSLLVSYPSEFFEFYEVSAKINSPSKNSPELINAIG